MVRNPHAPVGPSKGRAAVEQLVGHHAHGPDVYHAGARQVLAMLVLLGERLGGALEHFGSLDRNESRSQNEL